MQVSEEINTATRYEPTLLEKLIDRPALLIFFVFVVIEIILIYNFQFENVIIHFSLILSPMIPAIYLENKWEKYYNKEGSLAKFLYQRVKKFNIIYILAGTVSSLIITFVAIISRNFIFQTNVALRLFALNATAMIVGIFISASFFRIREEDQESGKRYNLISAPSQAATLASYSLISSTFSIWLLWTGNLINISSIETTSEISSLENMQNGAIFVIYSIIASLYITIFYISKSIPNYIEENAYKRPKGNQLRNDLIVLGGFILIITYFLQIFLSDVIIIAFEAGHTLFLIGLPIILIILIERMQFEGALCPECHVIQTNNVCQVCNKGEKITLEFNFGIFNKVKHPKCPNCQQKWEVLSRECSNCDFTILLSCENCSQTLNPLWKKCNFCNEPRRSIPQIALDTPPSSAFARSQAVQLFLLSFLIPLIIIQINIITRVRSLVEQGILPEIELNYLNDDYIRIILLTIIAASIVLMRNLARVESNKPLVLIGTKITNAGGTILLFSTFMMLAISTIQRFFTESNLSFLERLLPLLVGLILLPSALWLYYRSLISYRPVVQLDTKLLGEIST